MGRVTTQCPHCAAWQVGAVINRRHSGVSRSSSIATPKMKRARSRQRDIKTLTKDEQWARAILASSGFLWGSDVGEKFGPAVRLRAHELTPRTGIRWWWHGASTGLYSLTLFLLSIDGQAELGALAVLLWLASLGSHGWFAFSGYRERHYARSDKEQKLWHVISDELAHERLNLLKDGPFGPSQAPPPSRKAKGIDDEQAEHLCAQWLENLGELGVRVTRAKSDGGIDIVSTRCVAQVKNYKGSVGVVPIRELVGVASVDGRFPVFFTSGEYTKAALDFAEAARVYLFKYDAEAGTLDAKSSVARNALASN